MSLPSPLPDNPLRWEGWKDYKSDNPYERLGLDFLANPSNEEIEENCRQILVWWQKKLPLKNQPSNPMAQLLRGGMDEAPACLAEARTLLLDPAKRAEVDTRIREGLREEAMQEFYKLFDFATASGELSDEGEDNLIRAGQGKGLNEPELRKAIEVELVLRGIKRKVTTVAPPPPSPGVAAPMPSPVLANPENNQAGLQEPATEFRRVLRMSKLEDGMMTDDQRDALCNIGESLGLTGGQAEDLIDEYLDEMEGLPPLPASAPARPAAAVAPKPAAAKPVAAPQPARELVNFDFSPLRRAEERERFPNFTNTVGMEMLLIQSGIFQMGSAGAEALPNERPICRVGVGSFYIARTPVTNALYEKFDPAHRSRRGPWANDQHPVIYVNTMDAARFCEWLSAREKRKYRLPTEAEWEYAARGSDGRIFPWGNRFTSDDLANFADTRTSFAWRETKVDDGYAETSPVGTYPKGASPFGVLDMAGNVWEWCHDFFSTYTAADKVNPRGPAKGTQRVYRGGSWKSRIGSLRTTVRGFNVPGFSANDVGFRVICECEKF